MLYMSKAANIRSPVCGSLQENGELSEVIICSRAVRHLSCAILVKSRQVARIILSIDL
jgi:hypothetical protein